MEWKWVFGIFRLGKNSFGILGIRLLSELFENNVLLMNLRRWIMLWYFYVIKY